MAALGLNWSIEPAVDASSHVAGDIRYSNMTQYYFGDAYDSNSADQITAHLVCGLGLDIVCRWDSLCLLKDSTAKYPPLHIYGLLQVVMYQIVFKSYRLSRSTRQMEPTYGILALTPSMCFWTRLLPITRRSDAFTQIGALLQKRSAIHSQSRSR